MVMMKRWKCEGVAKERSDADVIGFQLYIALRIWAAAVEVANQ